MESAREKSAKAGDKIKEVTAEAKEKTAEAGEKIKEATAEAKDKADEAVENVRQSFSGETGVDASVDPKEPIEPSVTTPAATTDMNNTQESAPKPSDNPDLVGQVIKEQEENKEKKIETQPVEPAAAQQSEAEKALEEVKEAGVKVRDAVQENVKKAEEAISNSTQESTTAPVETDSQAGTVKPQQ